jgi:hypothetical protein
MPKIVPPIHGLDRRGGVAARWADSGTDGNWFIENSRDGMDDNRVRDEFRMMCLVRAFEDAVLELTAAGEVPGYVHPYTGQEAVAVGVLGRRDPRMGGQLLPLPRARARRRQ